VLNPHSQGFTRGLQPQLDRDVDKEIDIDVKREIEGGRKRETSRK